MFALNKVLIVSCICEMLSIYLQVSIWQYMQHNYHAEDKNRKEYDWNI